MLVKVCGMKYPENIREVAETGIDLMGFIFYPSSPRYISFGFPLSTFAHIPKSIRKVGVFVNEYIDVVADHVQHLGLDFVQLHGNESPRDCLRLREMDIPVIKNISIGSVNDFKKTEAYDNGVVDYLLFDTKSSSHGGSGQQFQWNWLDNYKGTTPFLLSGGITANDAETILSINHPQMAGVDLNSRFELEAARKDAALIKAFVQKIKKTSYSI